MPLPTHVLRCILSPKNEHVDNLNKVVTDMLPGQEVIYRSADFASGEDESLYPTEFLNTLVPQGFPPHELCLKIGCPIILIRNLNFALGELSNGMPSTLRYVLASFPGISKFACIIPLDYDLTLLPTPPHPCGQGWQMAPA